MKVEMCHRQFGCGQDAQLKADCRDDWGNSGNRFVGLRIRNSAGTMIILFMSGASGVQSIDSVLKLLFERRTGRLPSPRPKKDSENVGM